MGLRKSLALLLVAGLCACAAVSVAAAKTAKTTPVCKAGQVTTKKKPCTAPVVKNTCFLSVSGILGGPTSQGGNGVPPGATGGVAGGFALGAKYDTGGLVITCEGYSTGLTITAPFHVVNVGGTKVDAQAHTFSQSIAPKCAYACTSCTVTNASTLTCKLSQAEEKVGLKAVGNWQATISWHYSATDEAATNAGVVAPDQTYGSCKILIVTQATISGKVNATRSGPAACGYAPGDALQ